jgi:DNA-binding response OmpR family regulator
MHVLVVEDEPALGRSIARIFRERGYGADTVVSGADMLTALAEPRQKSLDVILLDWHLSDADGIDLVRQVRSRGDQTPVLMLTGRCEPDDVVRALDAGADDFVSKREFEPSVLVARAVALSRRAHAPRTPKKRAVGSFVIDEAASSIWVDGIEIGVSAIELRIMTRLAESSGRIVSRDELMSAGWGRAQAVSDNAFDTSLGRLRRRLGRFGHAIRSVRKRGVALVASSEQEATFARESSSRP